MSKKHLTFKNLWNGPHHSFVRYATVITAVFLVYVLFISDDSVIRWMRAGMELRQQRSQIENYKKEIAEMDSQVKMLTNDRDTLEEFARETFHFAAPGDDVYLLEK